MLRYTTRIRDIIHGFVLLTELERNVVDHPFFQRLRHVRQNDVTFYVYPSLNGTRFEHSLGACHLAGRMAQSLMTSRLWPTYFDQLKQETGITTEQQFVQLSRLYALLHDIGHFPLSHLFEAAFDNYVHHTGMNVEVATEAWTSKPGFKKLHSHMNMATKKEVLQAHLNEWLACRGNKKKRGAITRQLSKSLRMHVKSIARSMKRLQLTSTRKGERRGRPEEYGADVNAALAQVWEAMEYPCAENNAARIN